MDEDHTFVFMEGPQKLLANVVAAIHDSAHDKGWRDHGTQETQGVTLLYDKDIVVVDGALAGMGMYMALTLRQSLADTMGDATNFVHGKMSNDAFDAVRNIAAMLACATMERVEHFGHFPTTDMIKVCAL